MHARLDNERPRMYLSKDHATRLNICSLTSDLRTGCRGRWTRSPGSVTRVRGFSGTQKGTTDGEVPCRCLECRPSINGRTDGSLLFSWACFRTGFIFDAVSTVPLVWLFLNGPTRVASKFVPWVSALVSVPTCARNFRIFATRWARMKCRFSFFKNQFNGLDWSLLVKHLDYEDMHNPWLYCFTNFFSLNYSLNSEEW